MLRRLILALPLLAAGALSPAQAQQCDTRFEFVNRSSRTVMEFYFDASSNPNWTRDELGTGVMAPNERKNFRAARTGLYDFKAVWDNGRSAELRQIDICRASRVTLTDGGLTAE